MEGIHFLLRHHYSILGDGMGLGKTAQAIEVAKMTGLPTLVVCPSFLQGTWRNELKKWDGPKDANIVSYSMAHKSERLFAEAKLIIGDECHYLKNLDANRTLAFHHYIQKYKPERMVLLTGTAIKNRIGEFYSLLALCSYSPHPTNGINVLKQFPNYWSFCNYFSHAHRFEINGRYVTKYEGHKNVDKLKELLQGKYLRRKASEVLDLPPLIRKDVILNEDGIDYDLLKSWETKHFSTHKVNSAKIKVKHTIEYAKNLLEEGEGPLIIYTDHVDSAFGLHAGFTKHRAVCITGATPMEERDAIVEEFQQGKIAVLVATVGSLSVGVTLTASRNIIFNDLPWVPSDLAQAEKRIHRIGQTGTCIIHRIFWGKIDAYIGRQLESKLETLVAVL